MQIRKTKAAKMVMLGIFTAAAIVLQSVENLAFPSSLPFRPGMANIVSIIVIAVFGLKEAVAVTIIRTVLASLITGKFMGIPFVLSFSGGLASTVIMGFLFTLTTNGGKLGITGLSIIGSTIHNLIQFLIISFFLIPGEGAFTLIPWLWLTALGAGCLTAAVCIPALNIPVVKKLTMMKQDSSIFR